jgi:HD-GYP domain-containing protein (c-di-GMP phosphodiesterase class II)
VYDRHRLIGTMIAEYPTLEMLGEEYFARLCDRLQLDRPAMLSLARTDIRYRAAEASSLQKMLAMLLKDTQQVRQADVALTSLSTNLASTYEELSLLYRISRSMKVSQAPRPFLGNICEQLLDVMPVELTAAVVFDARMKMDNDIVVLAGPQRVVSEQVRLLAATRIVPEFAVRNNVVLENRLWDIDLNVGLRLKQLLAVPLMIDEQIIGVLMAVNRQEGDFNSIDLKLLGSIADQASVFLANHSMYAELQDLLMGVLHSLTESIDAKDPYTCGHSRRVAEISRRLASDFGFPPEQVQHIYLSGLLHDVGKIGVPDPILTKDGRLTEEEYEIMKQHPVIGGRILRRIRNLKPIISGVLSHHERLDGRGYPDGLSGQDVPIEGRIVGLADSWDAMTSHRTYRRALSIERAIQEIRDCSGTQFDPALSELFLQWDLPAVMEELHALNATDLHLLSERLY